MRSKISKRIITMVLCASIVLSNTTASIAEESALSPVEEAVFSEEETMSSVGEAEMLPQAASDMSESVEIAEDDVTEEPFAPESESPETDGNTDTEDPSEALYEEEEIAQEEENTILDLSEQGESLISLSHDTLQFDNSDSQQTAENKVPVIWAKITSDADFPEDVSGKIEVLENEALSEAINLLSKELGYPKTAETVIDGENSEQKTAQISLDAVLPIHISLADADGNPYVPAAVPSYKITLWIDNAEDVRGSFLYTRNDEGKITDLTDKYTVGEVTEEEMPYVTIEAENTGDFLFVKEKSEVIENVICADPDPAEEAGDTIVIEETESENEDTSSAESTEELTEEPIYESETLYENGADYSITVEYTEEAKIPEGSSLRVEEITQDTVAYDECAQTAMDALFDEATNLPYARFFDITIISKEGEEIQPAAPVSVTIVTDDAKPAAENVEAAAVHIEEEKDDMEAEEVAIEDAVADTDAFNFMAESFSVYGVICYYTVDFYYENEEYHLSGGGELTLSDLFTYLAIDRDTADVENVEFSNDDLIRVEENDGNYTLISLAPFTTSEYLTVYFNDGNKIIISVMDDQSAWLSDYEYTVDNTNHTITLTKYIGNDTVITVPATAVIDNVTYTTNISQADGYKSVFNPTGSSSKVYTSITFEEGVTLPQNCSGLFYGLKLQSMDLSGVSFSNVDTAAQMFYNCSINHLEPLDISGAKNISELFKDADINGIVYLDESLIEEYHHDYTGSFRSMADGTFCTTNRCGAWTTTASIPNIFADPSNRGLVFYGTGADELLCLRIFGTKRRTGFVSYGGTKDGEYTVSFDANGGVYAPPDMKLSSGQRLTTEPAMYSYGSDTLPDWDPYYGGNTYSHPMQCIGWNTAPDGSGTFYSRGDIWTGTGDVTLYAQYAEWAAIGNNYDFYDQTGSLTYKNASNYRSTAMAMAAVEIWDGGVFSSRPVYYNEIDIHDFNPLTEKERNDLITIAYYLSNFGDTLSDDQKGYIYTAIKYAFSKTRDYKETLDYYGYYLEDLNNLLSRYSDDIGSRYTFKMLVSDGTDSGDGKVQEYMLPGTALKEKEKSILIRKEWRDGGNTDLRGNAVIDLFNVLDNTTPVQTMTMTKTNADEENEDVWIGIFENVPDRNQDGSMAEYFIRERPLNYYSTTYKSRGNALKINYENINGSWGFYVFDGQKTTYYFTGSQGPGEVIIPYGPEIYMTVNPTQNTVINSIEYISANNYVYSSSSDYTSSFNETRRQACTDILPENGTYTISWLPDYSNYNSNGYHLVTDIQEGILETDDPINEKFEIVNTLNVLPVYKIDQNGDPVTGAVLQIINDDTDEVVYEWTSTRNPFLAEYRNELIAGETYRLHEVSAPAGYRKADDITFTVKQTNTNAMCVEIEGSDATRLDFVNVKTAPDVTFDDYYVEGQKILGNHLSKIDDFTVKYQMEAHFSRDVKPGLCEIRVPKTLFEDRHGNPVDPSAISVPAGTPSSYTPAFTTPFNYYEDDDDLVFWNYREIQSGTNCTIQVLFPEQNALNVIDGTTWEITPSLTATYPSRVQGVADTVREIEGVPLTGEVNTQVKLYTLTKEPLRRDGKNYTPGLYTRSQVSSFIHEDYQSNIPSEFDDYVYVVWRVKATGGGNQPYQVYVKDVPSVEGVSGTVIGFNMAATLMTEGEYAGYYKVSEYSNRNYTLNPFEIVAAYPKSEVTAGTTVLENEIEAILHPIDDIDEDTVLTAEAEWTYVDYKWIYEGDTIGVLKYNYVDYPKKDHDYDGWMDLYRSARLHGNDMKAVRDFNVHGILRTFNMTHYTTKEEGDTFSIGDYRPGAFVKMSTVDDILIAYPKDGPHAGESFMLDDRDYYFDSVVLHLVEQGYDIYEDTYDSVTNDKQIDRTCRFYAMYAGSDEWELAGSIPFRADGDYTYTFTQAQLNREPWRVKIEFNATEYLCDAYMDLGVTIRHDSPVFATLGSCDSVQLENIDGIYGWYESDDTPNGYYIQDTSIENGNYSEEGVEEKTLELYDTILMRDNAFGTFYSIRKHAESSKEVTTKSDSVNGRVNLTYTLKAFEGYRMYEESVMRALKGMDIQSPDRTAVEYYDLLPVGVKFDPSAPIIAGRLNRASTSQYSTTKEAWKKANVSVTVDPETDVIDDWNGTGRMMVIFHINYDGDTTSAFDEDNHEWFTGYGVQFGAYVNWNDLKHMSDDSNIAAYMPAPSDTRPLLGTSEEVSFDDGNPLEVNADNTEFLVFGSDINGDGVTNIRNVLFAKSRSLGDYAVSASSGIQKKVRADRDVFSEYTNSTAVSYNEGYTYQITVRNSARHPLKDIIVFDRLENAALDRRVQEPDIPFEADGWHGTFESLYTGILDKYDIAPVVYYNTNRDAVLPVESQDPYTILAGNGWVAAEDYAGDPSDVKAVAVDLSHKTDGSEFMLENNETVSFTMHMRAPNGQQTYEWAYNNPAFYSTSIGDTAEENVSETVVGNSVLIKLSGNKNFVVNKVFDGSIPEELKNTAFEFTLKHGTEKLPYKVYELYRKNPETGDYDLVEEDIIHSTDGNGHFYLCADERAVFYNIPDAEHTSANETADMAWDCQVDTADTQTEHIITATNSYCPVLFLSKNARGVPTNVDIENEEFHFLITNNGVPMANKTVYVMPVVPGSILAMPEPTGTKTTDANGIVTLGPNEIICVQLDEVGDEWEIIEQTDSYGDGTNWICTEPEKSGTADVKVNKAAVENFYRYKQLQIHKRLVNQTTSDYAFGFKVWKLNEDSEPEGDDPSLYTSLVTGKSWFLREDPEINGVIGADGLITCAAGGKNIVVDGLDGGATYIIQEVDCGNNYEAQNTTSSTYLPLYGTVGVGTITNVWQICDLDVEKRVFSSSFVNISKTFSIKIEIKEKNSDTWVPLANTSVNTKLNGSSYTKTTDANGVILLRAGETAHFEDVAKIGSLYRISETADATYPPLYPAAGEYVEGEFNLSANEVSILNGTDDMLYIKKKYVPAQSDLSNLDNANTESAKKANALNNKKVVTFEFMSDLIHLADIDFNAYVYLEVKEGGEWRRVYPGEDEYNVYIIMTDGSVYSYSSTWYNENGAFVLPVSATVCIEKVNGSLKNVQYRIVETGIWSGYVDYPITSNIAGSDNDPGSVSGVILDCSTARYYFYYVNAGKKEIIVNGNGAGNNIITVTNDISYLGEFKRIRKAVDDDFNYGVNVPDGSKLAYRFERFNGTSWEPEPDVPYVINKQNDNTARLDYVTIRYSDENGMAYTEKRNNETTIYVPDYVLLFTSSTDASMIGKIRIVEDIENSDSCYGIRTKSVESAHTPNQYYLTNLIGGNIIEVEKETNKKTGDAFEFVLSCNDNDSIVHDMKIPYSVYDKESNEKISDGYIYNDGVFSLTGGQYAKIYVPMGEWVVKEKDPYPWVLESVTGENFAEGDIESSQATYRNYPVFLKQAGMAAEAVAHAMGKETIKQVNVKRLFIGNKIEYGSEILNAVSSCTIDYYDTGQIKAYIVPYNDGYDVYYIAENEDKVKASQIDQYADNSIVSWYKETIEYADVHGLDITNITDISSFCSGATKLEYCVGMNEWDWSNIKDGAYLFSTCDSLKEINLSGINAPNLIHGMYMGSCPSLEKLDMSGAYLPNARDSFGLQNTGINTENGCYVDFSGFQIGRFQYALNNGKISTMDLTDLKVLDPNSSIYNLFHQLSIEEVVGLNTIDLSNASYIQTIFSYCTFTGDNVVLDFSGLSFDSATQVSGLVSNHIGVTKIIATDLQFPIARYVENLFSGDYQNAQSSVLQEIDASGLYAPLATTFSNNFGSHNNLKKLDISDSDLSSITTTYPLWNGGTGQNVEYCDASNLKTGKTYRLFADCAADIIDVTNLELTKEDNSVGMFVGCPATKIIGIETMDLSKVNSMNEMFAGTFNLSHPIVMSGEYPYCKTMTSFAASSGATSVDISGMQLPICTTMAGSFAGMRNCTSFNLKGVSAPLCTEISSIFGGASNCISIDMSECNFHTLYSLSSVFNTGLTALKTLDMHKSLRKESKMVQTKKQHCAFR